MTLSQATIYSALIAAGAAVVGFAVALLSSLLIERIRERRLVRQQRDQAIAELLTAVVDLVTGIQTVRSAYQGQGGWRQFMRRNAVVLAAIGSEYGSPAGLSIEEFLDWRRLAPVVDRLLAAIRDLDDRQRLISVDLATLLLPRTARYYAAIAVLTLGPDKEIADAVRRLTPAIGGLIEAIAAKPRKYERARRRAEHALGDFRAVADDRKR